MVDAVARSVVAVVSSCRFFCLRLGSSNCHSPLFPFLYPSAKLKLGNKTETNEEAKERGIPDPLTIRFLTRGSAPRIGPSEGSGSGSGPRELFRRRRRGWSVACVPMETRGRGRMVHVE